MAGDIIWRQGKKCYFWNDGTVHCWAEERGMLGCVLLLLIFESIILDVVVTKGVVDTETLHYGVNGAWLGYCYQIY